MKIIEGIKRFGSRPNLISTLLPQRSMWSVATQMRKLRNGEGNLSKIETAIINARLKDTTWSIQELDRLVAIVQAMGPHRSALLKQFPDKPYLSIRW